MKLRCEHKTFGILTDGKLEVRCDSRLCGKRPGVIVLHTIDIVTGEVETRKFKEPPTSGGAPSGARRQHPALRMP